jgi:hypothetical protein
VSKGTGTGASLQPETFGGGQIIPDGRYIIKEIKTTTFNYAGKGPESAACAVIFRSADGTDHEQYYSAGKMEFLVPNEANDEFVHPDGGDARIAGGSNFALFMTALKESGFPMGELGAKVTGLLGADLDIANKAQPKREGLKDQKDNKTIPLPVKYYGKAKGVAKGAAKTTTTAKAEAPAANGATLDEEARNVVLMVLAEAPDNTMSRVKLGTQVMLKLAKDKSPNMAAIKKLASDPAWLASQAEAGGWTVAEDNVTVG